MLPKENVPGSPHGYAAGHPLPVWVIFDAPQAYRTDLVYLNDRKCGAHSDIRSCATFGLSWKQMSLSHSRAKADNLGQIFIDKDAGKGAVHIIALTSGRQELTPRSLGPLSLGRCRHI